VSQSPRYENTEYITVQYHETSRTVEGEYICPYQLVLRQVKSKWRGQPCHLTDKSVRMHVVRSNTTVCRSCPVLPRGTREVTSSRKPTRQLLHPAESSTSSNPDVQVPCPDRRRARPESCEGGPDRRNATGMLNTKKLNVGPKNNPARCNPCRIMVHLI
jgi:hypothetical protein